jgi:hypothetical protein
MVLSGPQLYTGGRSAAEFASETGFNRGIHRESAYLGDHVSEATALWLQTMVPLTASDTVELQRYFRVADGYFAADQTSFWGCRVG